MHRPLENHVAWVTGSSTGLGKAIAVALGDAGAQVAFNYQRNRSRAEATFAAYEATGAKGLLVRGDVTDPDEVNRMQREIAEKLGPVDILVPNATPDQPQRPIEEYDWAFYQTMLDYFVKSPFLLARACLPEMKRRKWGRIVNIGSEAFQRGVGNFSAYVAAKGGQTGWTRSLASRGGAIAANSAGRKGSSRPSPAVVPSAKSSAGRRLASASATVSTWLCASPRASRTTNTAPAWRASQPTSGQPSISDLAMKEPPVALPSAMMSSQLW